MSPDIRFFTDIKIIIVVTVDVMRMMRKVRKGIWSHPASGTPRAGRTEEAAMTAAAMEEKRILDVEDEDKSGSRNHYQRILIS